MPRVSVIIPTYNRSHLVSDAIDSVLAQSYGDLEIIVIDDGSTDDTQSVLDSYSEKIRMIFQANKGMGGSYARNAGIDVAEGEFIAFLDSDDEWLPEKLEHQVERLETNSAIDLVYSDLVGFFWEERNYYRWSETRKLFEGDILEHLILGNFVQTSTVIVRRDVFNEVGVFWPSRKATDWDMWLRISEGHVVGLIPDVLARYRIHPESVTNSLAGQQSHDAAAEVIKRAISRNPDRLESYKNQALARMNVRIGLTMARNGHLKQSRRMFQRSIDLMPSSKMPYLYWLLSFVGNSAFSYLVRTRQDIRFKRSNYGVSEIPSKSVKETVNGL